MSVRLPAHQHGTWLLALVEAKQEIGEAHDSAGTLVTAAANSLGQRVIGAMRKGIAIDNE
jgi:hypothetical protein